MARRNMVLTGASMFHSKYLDLFTNSDVPAIVKGRQMVLDWFTGEDLVFGFMHAHHSGLCPLVVDAVHDYKLMKGAPGLQQRGNHFSQRRKLLNELVTAFDGVVPLKPALGVYFEGGHPRKISCETPDKLPKDMK
jgi:Glycosyl transferase family 64 domain